jgi:Mu transposase-like protein
MRATDAQVRRLMDEFARCGRVGLSGMRAGLSRHTAARYIELGKLPSELKQPRTWRTRPDPFEDDWPEIAARLEDAPELEAGALFEELLARKPDRYDPGQVRTFRRRVRLWRATEGPEKEVFFPQAHRPGEAMQTDFTWANELGVTIVGEPFPHRLCHPVLPYSNWEWATVCHSEALASLKRGVQQALFLLGRRPKFHQTDNSTAATHDLRTGKRGFNEDYLAFMRHFGMEPRTIAIGESHQNGDAEALNGALKRRLRQHLLLRGSTDFPSVEEYEGWIGGVVEKANRLRQRRLREELAVMLPIEVGRFPEFTEISVPVTSWSTIRIGRKAYSVPSRLSGEVVRVRVYEQRLEVFLGNALQLAIERETGERRHRINYRHVIASLVKKPGAFRRYRYRDDLFPSETFRKAHDVLGSALTDYKADVEFLRVLHLAATTVESEVERTVTAILLEGGVPTFERVRERLDPKKPEIPAMAALDVDLTTYDELIELDGSSEEVSAS